MSGPESELQFCGPITDDGDRLDYEMAREYLARHITNPLQAAVELSRFRDAAQRLVRSAWGRQRITMVADALLRHGTLTGEQIAGLSAPWSFPPLGINYPS